MWYVDPKATNMPRYPLRDALKFQIKSTMKTNRALFYSEHIGGQQYRLRIQNNNPDDKKQWWSFDMRTRTVRCFYRRGFALSNQKGQAYKIGVAAVARQFTGEVYQRIKWIDRTRRTIQNIRGKCLDVHGGSNTNKRHVIFWNCHNGLNQGWKIDQLGFKYPRQPLGDNVRFQIKSQMKYHRALFYKEHIGGQQYRLRIRDNNPENVKQWWIFNRRTRTIRAANNRNMVIANQAGQGYRIGVAATIRAYKKEVYQRAVFYGGARRNIRNMGQKCLDVHGNSNTHNRHVTFWNCHNGLNQAWYLDRKTIRYAKYPERDGVLFQIRTRMNSKRVLFAGEHIGGQQWRLRIKKNTIDKPMWWTFDYRTKTVRLAADRRKVLSGKKGQYFRRGATAVVRMYANSFYQRTHWIGGHYRNIQNNGKMCLDVHGGSDTENRHVIWWTCHNGKNQGWNTDKKVYKMKYPRYPLGDGIRFQIKSRMSGNRALYWRNHIGGNQYRTYIQDNNPMDNRQWFTFDWRTKTIRAWARRNYALSVR